MEMVKVYKKGAEANVLINIKYLDLVKVLSIEILCPVRLV